MGEVPAETKYARTADGTHIAYMIVGDGSLDLVLVPGFASHLEVQWEYPFFAQFLTRLASFCRLIVLDKRGQGLSDPVACAPTLEERMDDIRAVMSAASSKRAALWANGEAAPTALLFCATFPDRVSALILAYAAHARYTKAPDYPWGPDRAAFEQIIETAVEDWGTGHFYSRFFAPMTDARFAARMERYSLSPGSVRANLEVLAETDVRHLLGSIRVPSLVLAGRRGRRTAIGHSTYLADNIRGARLVEHPPVGVADDVDPFEDVAEVQEFLTGSRPPPEPDRILATVLFTDIVSSTPQAVDAGDRRWRDILDRYDDLAAREVGRFRGRVIKSTGDGVLAVFDGPGRAVRCAVTLCAAIRGLGLAQRAGLHTGEIELRGNDISGLAVIFAQRVSAIAGTGDVLVSRTVVDLVAGSGIEFDSVGEYKLKGIPGTWPILAVRQ
jgi:class 3 adenylate cyclase